MPDNLAIEDIKPQNLEIIDSKPLNLGEIGMPVDKVYSVTIPAGQMIPLGALLYTTEQIVQSPYSH